MLPLLYIVIPCSDASSVLPFSIKLYEDKLDQLIICKMISPLSRILLVDNGSRDETWKTVLDISDKNPVVSGIRLSRRFGRHNAVVCGLDEVKDRCDIVIAADLFCRKDINAIDRMVNEYKSGSKIVFTKRLPAANKSRIGSAFSKKKARIDPEYFLITKDVINELERYRDGGTGLIKALVETGFESSVVFYEKRKTFDVSEKISISDLKEKFSLFFGSFFFPIHIMFITGLVFSLCSALCLTVATLFKILGFAGEIGAFSTAFFFSLRLLISGIIGEYIIKILKSVRKYPLYVIRERTENNKQ